MVLSSPTLLNPADSVAQSRDSGLTGLSLQRISGHGLNRRHLLLRIPGKNILLKLGKGQSSFAEQTTGYRLSRNRITALRAKPTGKKR